MPTHSERLFSSTARFPTDCPLPPPPPAPPPPATRPSRRHHGSSSPAGRASSTGLLPPPLPPRPRPQSPPFLSRPFSLPLSLPAHGPPRPTHPRRGHSFAWAGGRGVSAPAAHPPTPRRRFLGVFGGGQRSERMPLHPRRSRCRRRCRKGRGRHREGGPRSSASGRARPGRGGPGCPRWGGRRRR